MTKIDKQTIEDLKARGYVEGRPETVPENVDPAIRSTLMEEWRKDNKAGPLDMPTAVERGNELARERAAAEGDKAMQERFEVTNPKRDPLDHDGDGVRGGSKYRKPKAVDSDTAKK